MEKRPVVAFLGPKASYTHQAALQSFPRDYTLSPEHTIEDVLTAVQTGRAHRGVVPFENSTNGSVIFTLDLFADLPHRHPDILVCGEVYVDVHHCLLGYFPQGSPKAFRSSGVDMGPRLGHSSTAFHSLNPADAPRQLAGYGAIAASEVSPSMSGTTTPTPLIPNPKPPAKPVTSLDHIKTVYSHPQAWGQCNSFLKSYLKKVDRQDVSSTSRAAELVAQDRSRCTAAISSELAAAVHGLAILAKGIEDRGDNCTRFFILRKRQGDGDLGYPDPSPEVDGAVGNEAESPSECIKYKSLLSFTVPHSSPGALADTLAAFKHYGVNLTSINTRPSGVAAWHYVFFVEFQGRRGDGGGVDAALAELARLVRGWRFLGSWVDRNKVKE